MPSSSPSSTVYRVYKPCPTDMIKKHGNIGIIFQYKGVPRVQIKQLLKLAYCDIQSTRKTLSSSPSTRVYRVYKPCSTHMMKKYRNIGIKWICGGYQRARRSFKSICMMRYRNCEDGTSRNESLELVFFSCPLSSSLFLLIGIQNIFSENQSSFMIIARHR